MFSQWKWNAYNLVNLNLFNTFIRTVCIIISTPMGELKFEGLSFMQLLLLYTAFLMQHKKKKNYWQKLF